jgi:hypothetical protein
VPYDPEDCYIAQLLSCLSQISEGVTCGTDTSQSNHTPAFSGLDLTVASVQTVRIRGRVINGVTGQPARNANLSLQPRGRGDVGPRLLQGLRDAEVNDEGAFEIRKVTPGSYELVGVIDDGNNRMSGFVSLEVGNSDMQNVILVVSPGFSIVGRVSFEDQSAGSSVACAAPMRE